MRGLEKIDHQSRVVSVEAEPLPKNLALLQHNYLKCCKDLISGKPLEARPGSGILHDDVGPPQLLLLDVGIPLLALANRHG